MPVLLPAYNFLISIPKLLNFLKSDVRRRLTPEDSSD